MKTTFIFIFACCSIIKPSHPSLLMHQMLLGNLVSRRLISHLFSFFQWATTGLFSKHTQEVRLMGHWWHDSFPTFWSRLEIICSVSIRDFCKAVPLMMCWLGQFWREVPITCIKTLLTTFEYRLHISQTGKWMGNVRIAGQEMVANQKPQAVKGNWVHHFYSQFLVWIN